MTQQALVPVDQAQQQAQQFESWFDSNLATYMQLERIDTDDQLQWLVNAMHMAKDCQKQIELARDSIFKPIELGLKRGKAFFKKPIDKFKGFVDKGRELTAEYQQRKAATIQASLAEATTQAEVRVATQVLQQPIEGLSQRDHWVWELVDANQVPREYWVIDTVRLDREARELKDKLAVPGIRPVNKPVPVLR